MDKATHVPKKIMVNGKEKTVYVRTDQTERELDHYRMGFFAGVDPLPLASFGDKLKEKQLIILASYNISLSVIRSRLELDRRPHKVFTGTTLLQYYFANDNYRDGFPVFKQFYLQLGYVDSLNKKLHELVVETLFTRHRAENHFWLIMPFNLDVMAVQWGSSLMNLQVFPTLDLRKDGEEIDGPVSIANPTISDEVGEQVEGRVVKHSSYPEEPDEFAAPPPISVDPEEARKQERDWKKFRRRSYE